MTMPHVGAEATYQRSGQLRPLGPLHMHPPPTTPLQAKSKHHAPVHWDAEVDWLSRVAQPLAQGRQSGFTTEALPPADHVPTGHGPHASPPVPRAQATGKCMSLWGTS